MIGFAEVCQIWPLPYLVPLTLQMLYTTFGKIGPVVPEKMFRTTHDGGRQPKQTALDFSPNDEQELSTAEHWPRFITLEAVLSDP